MFSFMKLALLVLSLLCIVHAKAPNPFEANLRKRIDPEDEMLKRALWAGARDNPYDHEPASPSKTANRLPKSHVITYSLRHKKRDFKPLIGFPSCLKCAGKAKFSSSLSYDDFTPEKMVQKIMLGGLNGACLFYGQREKGATPPSLSGSADQLGCLMSIGNIQTRAIWNMWPQDKAKSCEVGYDYYCLNAWEPSCCWLNPLMGDGQTKEEREPRTRPYFQSMSAAMAMTCTDTVYLLHEHPQDLGYQPIGQPDSIWNTHEVKVLKQLYARGTVKALKVIPATQEGTVLTYDTTKWIDRTDELKKPVKRDGTWTEEMANAMKIVLKHHESEQLHKPRAADLSSFPNFNTTDPEILDKRWSLCASSAANREDPHLDYFG